MGLYTSIAAFLIIWWLTFFVVLPWHIQPISHKDVADGHDPGAPRHTRLWFKLAVNTVIAAVIWGILFLAVEQGWLDWVGGF